VGEFYRSRGYEVREGVKVRGASHNVYTLEMVAEGPLGALLVSFGDAAGVDAAEVARVRTIARDIGATPVLATPAANAEIRRIAAQLTVVLLEEESLDHPAPKLPGPALANPLEKDLAAHPWPESGRAGPADGPPGLLEVEQVVKAEPAPAAWHPTEMPEPPTPRPAPGKFSWLDSTDAAPTGPRPPLPPPKPIEHEATVEARMPPQTVSMARLALYVALGMFGLYLLVKLLG
jgi:hypothetical protein